MLRIYLKSDSEVGRLVKGRLVKEQFQGFSTDTFLANPWPNVEAVVAGTDLSGRCYLRFGDFLDPSLKQILRSRPAVRALNGAVEEVQVCTGKYVDYRGASDNACTHDTSGLTEVTWGSGRLVNASPNGDVLHIYFKELPLLRLASFKRSPTLAQTLRKLGVPWRTRRAWRREQGK